MASKDERRRPLRQTREASDALAALNQAKRAAFEEQGSYLQSVPVSRELFDRIHAILAELANEETAGRRGPNAKRRDLLWRQNSDFLAWKAVCSTRFREIPRDVSPKGIVARVVRARQKARAQAANRKERGMKPDLESTYKTVARVFAEHYPDLPQTENAVRDAYRRHRARLPAQLRS